MQRNRADCYEEWRTKSHQATVNEDVVPRNHASGQESVHNSDDPFIVDEAEEDPFSLFVQPRAPMLPAPALKVKNVHTVKGKPGYND
jgi:hypothetical protein